MIKLVLFLLTISLTTTTLAESKQMSYSFIQGGVYKIFNRGKGTGYFIEGSYEVAPFVALNTSFQHTKPDNQDWHTDTTRVGSLGAKLIHSLPDNTDVFGGVNLLRYKIGGNSKFEAGYSLDLGVRHLLKDTVEMTFQAFRSHIDDTTSNSYSAGLGFLFKENIMLGISISKADYSTGLTLGYRVLF